MPDEKLDVKDLDRVVIKTAIVGGGPKGAFIGSHHDTGMYLANRLSAAQDEVPIAFEVVASALSRDADKSEAQGRRLGVLRVYRNYEELIEAEAYLDPSERARAVSIRLPNVEQHAAVMAFLNEGYHVIVDKPNAISPTQAIAQASLAREKGAVTAVTFTYSGSPMVRELQHLVRTGRLGEINAAHQFYPQGWTIGLDPAKVWRLRPEVSGPFGVTADLGATHCLMNFRFVTGYEIDTIVANLAVVGHNRKLDNYGQWMFRASSGDGKTLLGDGYCSQVAGGRGNPHELRLEGLLGSGYWINDDVGVGSDALSVTYAGQNGKVILARDGNGLTSPSAKRACRAPGFHGEGFDHWFGAIYRDAGAQIAGAVYGVPVDPAAMNIMTLEDGARSLWLLYKLAESDLKGGMPVDARFDPDRAQALQDYVIGKLPAARTVAVRGR